MLTWTNEPRMILSEADIASRIASLREEILVLSETHNTNYAATADLPPEVLSQIFECVAHKPFMEVEPPRAFYTWIKEVTHICRSWRSVALATPRLWSSVYLFRREWAELVLQRTKSVPLDLIFSKPHGMIETDTDLIRVAFTRPEHIRSLDISFVTEKVNPALELIASLVSDTPATQLQRLHLSSRWQWGVVPDALFSQSRLQHLTLKNCIVTLNTPRFSRLRSMHLVQDLRKATWMDLLGALSTMHELKALSLEDNVNSEDEGEHGWTRIIQMPSLQEVALKANFPEPMGILRLLTAPLARMVDINLARIRDTEAVVYAYSFLKVNQVSRTPAPLQRVAISQTNLGTISLCLVADVEDAISPAAGMAGMARIEIQLDNLWACLPKYNIVALRLDSAYSPDGLHSFRMTDIITSLSDSPTLDMLRAPYDAFLPLLFIPGSLPALRALVLDCRSRKPRNSTLHHLNRWLIQRQALGGTALERLLIIGCPHMRPSIEETLRSSVGNFRYSRSRGRGDIYPFQ
ncbi:hypothetical protein EYR36_003045 [Pleurotus pulmonarius]|nr:hypothetical protein EYR36_003045 [Pleurotus pulmonarius]KAF4582589.1 hypothetical protein EYR38_002717 [Pleurotus pulmonarius]